MNYTWYKITELGERLVDKQTDITSLHFVINPKKNDSFTDLEIQHFAGKQHITEKLGNLNFQIGPKTFFQTNTRQAEKLYGEVKKLAALEHDEIVYDLYTGIGSIALFLATDVKKVVGVEIVEESIRAAKQNARLNKIDNCEFYTADVKSLLNQDFSQQHGQPDTLVVDPPRAGLHSEVVKQICEIAPRKVIYVSCNPSTQARDLEMMKDKYEINIVQPVDMFPQTVHVENVVRLTLR